MTLEFNNIKIEDIQELQTKKIIEENASSCSQGGGGSGNGGACSGGSGGCNSGSCGGGGTGGGTSTGKTIA